MSFAAKVRRTINSRRSSAAASAQAPGAENAPEQPRAERAREQEADEGEEVDARDVRAVRREDADQARSDQAADDDERDDQPVEGHVDLVHELVEALVHEADLDLAVADLLEEVVDLPRHRRRCTPARSTPSAPARGSAAG